MRVVVSGAPAWEVVHEVYSESRSPPGDSGLIAKGQDIEQVVKADPLRNLFIDSANPPTSLWARLVYQELARTQAR